MDPPVPEYSDKIYGKCLHYLNSLVLKFQCQTGDSKVDLVKTVKEMFPSEEDNRDKYLTMMEILSVNNKSYNIFAHDGKKENWKEKVLDVMYDFVKGDLVFLKEYLERRFTDLKGRSDFTQTIRASKFR